MLAIDTYEVVDRGSRGEIEERALPFRVGEEVLVTIEEPHMYDADDAIAGSTPTSSAWAAAVDIGERRLVQIDKVARSAATASLIDANGEKLESPPSGEAPRPPRPKAP